MWWYFLDDDNQFRYCPQSVPDYLIDFVITYTYTDTGYCSQSLPDTTVTFDIVYTYTDTGYCPQRVPDYGFGIMSTQTDTEYCPQDTTGFFNVDFEVIVQTQTNTDFCPQNVYSEGQPGKVVDASYNAWGRFSHYAGTIADDVCSLLDGLIGPVTIHGWYRSGNYWLLQWSDKTRSNQATTVGPGWADYMGLTSVWLVREDGTSEASDIAAGSPGIDFYKIDYNIVLQRQTNTDYCPQDTTGFYDFAIAITPVNYCQQTLVSGWGIPNRVAFTITDELYYCQQAIQPSWAIPSRVGFTVTPVDYCQQVIDSGWGLPSRSIASVIQTDYCQQTVDSNWGLPSRTASVATQVDYCQQTVDSNWGLPSRTASVATQVDYCQQVIDPSWEIQV